MSVKPIIALLVIAVLTLLPPPPAWGDPEARLAQQSELKAEIERLQAQLAEAVSLYRQGQRQEAVDRMKDLFLAFEGTAFDRQLAARDKNYYASLEQKILALLAAMRAGAPSEEIERRAEEIARRLERGLALLLKPPGDIGAFLQSLTILLREGLEALLIVGAVLLVLRRSGQAEQTRAIYLGSGLGVVASLITAWLLQTLLKQLPLSREVIEGISMLLAVPVLFSVSYWLIALSQTRRWNAFLQRRVRQAVGAGREWALLTVAFLAVYREGAETVLFYQALAASVPGAFWAIFWGFWAGAGLLGLLWLAMHRFGVRIPLRPFFIATSAFLYYMAFRFAGAGIRELQEAGWVSLTPLPLLNALGPWLPGWLTIYPYWEPVLAQLLLLGALGIGLVLVIRPFKPRG